MSTELTTPVKIEIPGIGTIESADLYLKFEVDKVIADLKVENERINRLLESAKRVENCYRKIYAKDKRALWFMTAEWADAMCLASCNIANKYMSRDRFEVSEDYREKTVRKYRHRQVVFAKYADYCRAKADKFTEAK